MLEEEIHGKCRGGRCGSYLWNAKKGGGLLLSPSPLHCSGAINHLLLVTINHAGIDGLSTFHVFRCFFAHLGQLAYGEKLPCSLLRQGDKQMPCEHRKTPCPSPWQKCSY